MDRSSSPSSSCDSTSAKSTISSTASNDGSKQADLATTSRKKFAKLAKKSSLEIKRPKLKSYKSDILQSQWETMFGHLLDYKAVNGNCLVPHRYVENPALGAWVSTQRRQYKVWKEGRAWTGKANSTPIDPIRGQRLEEIGFVWSTNNPLKIPWERRYQELVGFKAKFGHCLVPSIYKPNPRLGHWVSTQRHDVKLMKKGHPTRMTKERLEALEKIGFVWVAPKGGDVRGAKRRSRNQFEEAGSDEDSDSPTSARFPTAGQILSDTASSTAGTSAQSVLPLGTNNEASALRPPDAEISDARAIQYNPFLLPSSMSVAASRLRLAAATGGNLAYPGGLGLFDAPMHPHIAAAHQIMLSNSLKQALSGPSFGGGGVGALFGGNLLGGAGGILRGGLLPGDPLLNARLGLLYDSQLLGSSELALLAALSGRQNSSSHGPGDRMNGNF